MTEKLYEKDSHASQFQATVLSCEKKGDLFTVILDRTLFFPESGGQSADEGTLDHVPVVDVQLNEQNDIEHYLKSPLKIGQRVNGKLNYGLRFQRMQLHTAEHIIVGLIHNQYGFDNVGFHLGSDDVTMDVNGILERDQLEEIEKMANEVVWRNVPVRAYYPPEEDLDRLPYRSKLELTHNVRLVEIEGVDLCACCAPHVQMTGEIGCIKILDYIHYKGGIRIHMLAGKTALDDYHNRYLQTASIARMLSVKQQDVEQGVFKLKEDLGKEHGRANAARREMMTCKTSVLTHTDGNLCLFEPNLSRDELRYFCNEALGHCGKICAVFSGDDEQGYAYVIASQNVPLRSLGKIINRDLHGQGGGSDLMLQGNLTATREEILRFFTTADRE